MTIPTDRRDNQAKIRLFRTLFSGLDHVYGTYDPKTGRVWQVKRPVTDGVILAHLTGKRPYGVYLLAGSKTRAVAVDFDNEDALLPREFVHAAAHYCTPAYIERSKSKGYHAWVFFTEQGVSAAKARRVVLRILEEIDCSDTEVFPKQDVLAPGTKTYGNFINAPLFGALVPQGRTVFVKTDGTMEPYANQWEFLEQVERVSEKILDDIIEINDLNPVGTPGLAGAAGRGTFKSLPRALPPCAQRMLEQGVTANQRVACFRLAIHLKRQGVPFDITVAALREWSKKNKPLAGKHVITDTEIKAQTTCAFAKTYAGCGCNDPAVQPFCDPVCRVRAARAQQ